ncbi:MAG: hypothetical protein ACTHMY_02000 [Solirubrobacteraceae bacterium]
MSDPKMEQDKRSEDDDLKLEPEMIKDLDVGDDATGQIRGGCSGSGTMSLKLTAPLNR